MAERTIRVTWLDKAGNAACLGRDETLITDWTDSEIIEAAYYRAECDGIDSNEYDLLLEPANINWNRPRFAEDR
jgi:hypothetical protein